MSVINSLGELKSGHHAGLGLKEVWAGGERVWSAARQFSIAGPRPGISWGVFRFDDGWDPDYPLLGDLDMVREHDPRFHIMFEGSVVCDRPVVARYGNRGQWGKRAPGTRISRGYQIAADSSGFSSEDQIGTYFTFTEVA